MPERAISRDVLESGGPLGKCYTAHALYSLLPVCQERKRMEDTSAEVLWSNHKIAVERSQVLGTTVSPSIEALRGDMLCVEVIFPVS